MNGCSLFQAVIFLLLELLVHGNLGKVEEVVVPSDHFGKINVASTVKLENLAEADNMSLNVASKEKATWAVNLLGSKGEPAGLCRVSLRFCVHPSGLQLGGGYSSLK